MNLGDREIDINDVKVLSACDVDLSLLIDFYERAYPDRVDSLKLNWKWLNRTDFYAGKIPLVGVYKNQVIAHAGMIPFKIIICGDQNEASWFIDFKILPEFQRLGLGRVLTREFMKISDCCLALSCNEKSLSVFKKLGWIESSDSYLHLNFLLPFNHPVFIRRLPASIRRVLNYLAIPFLFFLYNRNSYADYAYQLVKLSQDSFLEFFQFYAEVHKIHFNTVAPLRDIEWANWRILNSPNIDKYFIFKSQNINALIFLNDGHKGYIDILWVSDKGNKPEIKKLISTLCVYGIKNRYSYIRYYTSDKELSDFLKNKTKAYVSHPRFVYFSKSKNTFEKLKTGIWDFELIDNDFEHI